MLKERTFRILKILYLLVAVVFIASTFTSAYFTSSVAVSNNTFTVTTGGDDD